MQASVDTMVQKEGVRWAGKVMRMQHISAVGGCQHCTLRPKTEHGCRGIIQEAQTYLSQQTSSLPSLTELSNRCSVCSAQPSSRSPVALLIIFKQS